MSLDGQKARLAKYQRRIELEQPLPEQINEKMVRQMEIDLNGLKPATEPKPPTRARGAIVGKIGGK